LPFSYTCLFWNSNFLSVLHHHLLLLSLPLGIKRPPFEFVHRCHYSVALLFCSPQQRVLSFPTRPSSLWRHRAFIFPDKATETRTMSSSQNHSRSGSPTPLSAYDIFRLHTRSISNAEASTAWSVMGEQERSSWIDQEHAARRMGSHAYARKFLRRGSTSATIRPLSPDLTPPRSTQPTPIIAPTLFPALASSGMANSSSTGREHSAESVLRSLSNDKSSRKKGKHGKTGTELRASTDSLAVTSSATFTSPRHGTKQSKDTHLPSEQTDSAKRRRDRQAERLGKRRALDRLRRAAFSPEKQATGVLGTPVPIAASSSLPESHGHPLSRTYKLSGYEIFRLNTFYSSRLAFTSQDLDVAALNSWNALAKGDRKFWMDEENVAERMGTAAYLKSISDRWQA